MADVAVQIELPIGFKIHARTTIPTHVPISINVQPCLMFAGSKINVNRTLLQFIVGI